MTNEVVYLHVRRAKLYGMNRYVTVRCPSCRSVSQLKADAIRSEVFFCPVCEDGEIEYHPEPPKVFRDNNRLTLEWQDMVTVYSVAR
jgi:ssDNA-binding Zn-finger/Zn-ribbon topoisomerase 1